jgi:hypothetical protein
MRISAVRANNCRAQVFWFCSVCNPKHGRSTLRTKRSGDRQLRNSDEAIYKLIANGAFGPDEIEVMKSAYEAALIDVAVTDRNDHRAYCQSDCERDRRWRARSESSDGPRIERSRCA